MHIPLNMGRVFRRVQRHIEDADAYDPDTCFDCARSMIGKAGFHLNSGPDQLIPDLSC